jgi:hypothetical protein
MTKKNIIVVTTAICVLGGMPTIAGGREPDQNDTKSVIVTFENLDPFSHLASIPAGSDLSSLKLQGVKKVQVVTQLKLTTNIHYCLEQESRNPSGGSRACPRKDVESTSTAYRVTYSYRGEPLGSDEHGNTYFTFSVYFRPEELSPVAREILAKEGTPSGKLATYFALSTYRSSERRIVIDELASSFCSSDLIDGSRQLKDRQCKDNVEYKSITAPSDYMTVEVKIN